LATVILAALVVVWIVAGIMLDSERSVLRRWAVFMVLMVVILGWLDPRRGGEPLPLGSKMARDMLNDTWTRNGLSYPGPLTDGLNVFGALLIPLLVFTAFCLLLEPAHFPAEVGSDALRHVAHRWRQLHVLLYVSAAMLTAGVIEVVALYSWSLAPFPGVNEVKIHADICKTSGPVSQSVLDEGSIRGTKFCMNLAEELDHAEVIDSLRRVVRAHAVTFGAGFSALLASLYAPSVFLLRSRFRRLLELGSQNGVIASDAAVFKKYDLDTDLPGRLVNAVVTLGPLVTGVLSAVITF